ncbi:hypothetical protein ACFSMW_00490 [Virgibacillus halophilus]|uniref:Repeat domain-containing protein n=1 Tax=Tigheibacillus halophilus TaxID=361280 RepID=A0ABU5C1F4_9BACI|nr:hypothetical protein [Virgibacillus halophilus]
MSKRISNKLVIAAIITCFFFHLFNTSASAATSNENLLIQTFHEDVTGSGAKDTISLKGTPLSKDTDYYQNITLNITTSEGKELSFPLGGGYHPELSFVDLNHDQINDIFFTDSGSSFNEKYPYKAFSLKNGQLKELPKPASPFVKGDFSNKFKINLQLDPSDTPMTIDLTEKAQQYIQIGVYDQSGQLLKNPASISVGTISKIEPVFLGKQQGYALRSYLPIGGISKDDYLGSIETLWYFKNDQWQNLQTQWQPK